MFFHGWHSVLEVAIRAGVAYVVIVAILRAVGEQALAQMSAYDLIVTITLGGVVAGIPLEHDISIVDGIVAMVTFVVLQEAIRYARSRSRVARGVVSAPPKLVLWNGVMLGDRLDRWRLTEDEVRAAIRRHGLAAVEDVQAVVLENDGEWSVVARTATSESGSAFAQLDLP